MVLTEVLDLDFVADLESKCISLTTGKQAWTTVIGAVGLASDALLDFIYTLHRQEPSKQLIYAQPLNMCFRDFLVPDNDESFSAYKGRYFMTPECLSRNDEKYGSAPKTKILERVPVDLIENMPRLPLKFQLYSENGLWLGVVGYVMEDEFQVGIHYVNTPEVSLPACELAQSLYPVFKPVNIETKTALRA